MKKIISLVAATLLTVSSFSNADVNVYNSGRSFTATIGAELAHDEDFYFRVQPNYVRIFARDANDDIFNCHAYSDSNNYDELKEFIYSIKNESTVYMSRSGDDCVVGSYRVYAD